MQWLESEGRRLVDFYQGGECAEFIKQARCWMSNTVKAHRSKKEEANTCRSSGNKWSLKLVMLDGGEMTQIRAGPVQRKERMVYAALQCAACFH